MAKREEPSLIQQLEPIVHDAEKLVGLHSELLRRELRQSVDQATPALVSVGAGAGLAAAAGLLGSLAVVHVLHRSTRLPLWGCYGLVGGMLGAAGVGLMGSGARNLSAVNFIPHETIATLRDDLLWIKGKTT